MSDATATAPLREILGEALPERPFRIELWDGSELPNTVNGSGPVFTVHSPLALSHILRAPGQLGLGRAYVAGAITVDDVDDALDLLDTYKPPPIDKRTLARLAAAAVRAGALRGIPRMPTAELVPKGRRHSRERDARAIQHHYDVSNEFFALFLDTSMTYSCAVWSRGAETLEEAQRTKLDLVCTKLRLQPGQRLLDVGCGWGSMAIHAAREYGVQVVGITLSEEQAALARTRVQDAGLAGEIEIRLSDYRDDQGGPYDAISSIGMVEHVGSVNIDGYAAQLARHLRPGGRLLNHGITRLRHGDAEAGPFSERFVFPDAAPLHLSRIQTAVERAGFVTDHVEGFAEDYARTLREWTRRFEEHHAEAVVIGGEERVRVWQIYLRASRRGFESGFLGIYQVLAHLPA
jgi:cyclopropane-fatty-acyl-phospholipid synthase